MTINKNDRIIFILFGLFLTILFLYPESAKSDITFPNDSIINIKTDYGAKGNGSTDDTESIQKAISDNINDSFDKIIFFPNGTYIVSNVLQWKDNEDKWGSYITLQGESRTKTIIKLKDNADGYGDASNEKAIIYTASGLYTGNSSDGGKDWDGLGEGVEAFRNFIKNLTIHSGSGNPGAVAIDYLANNGAAIENVTIHSGDGNGKIGLSMKRKWIGPVLVKNVTIKGYDYGIFSNEECCSITLEHITLKGQKIAGIYNNENIIAIRDLKSTNSVPVIQNIAAQGLVVLVDGRFSGKSTSSAIENNGEIYLRNVKANKYSTVIVNKGEMIPGKHMTEFFSASYSLFPSPKSSLNLRIKETPKLAKDPLTEWVNVEEKGARGSSDTGGVDYSDDTEGIQEAMDSGKKVVYFPPGRYLISDTIKIRGNVSRVNFLGSWIGFFSYFNRNKPVFSVEKGNHDVVRLENMAAYWKAFDQSHLGEVIMIEHNSPNTLVLKDGNFQSYRSTAISGDLFLENVVGGGIWRFDYPQNIWARHFDPEGVVHPKIINNGANLWVLGLKVEVPTTNIVTTGRGRTEVLGAFLYPGKLERAPLLETWPPAFVNEESSLSLVYATLSYFSDRRYTVQIEETRDGETRELLSDTAISRFNYSYIIPLYTGYSDFSQ